MLVAYEIVPVIWQMPRQSHHGGSRRMVWREGVRIVHGEVFGWMAHVEIRIAWPGESEKQVACKTSITFT